MAVIFKFFGVLAALLAVAGKKGHHGHGNHHQGNGHGHGQGHGHGHGHGNGKGKGKNGKHDSSEESLPAPTADPTAEQTPAPTENPSQEPTEEVDVGTIAGPVEVGLLQVGSGR